MSYLAIKQNILLIAQIRNGGRSLGGRPNTRSRLTIRIGAQRSSLTLQLPRSNSNTHILCMVDTIIGIVAGSPTILGGRLAPAFHPDPGRSSDRLGSPASLSCHLSRVTTCRGEFLLSWHHRRHSNGNPKNKTHPRNHIGTEKSTFLDQSGIHQPFLGCAVFALGCWIAPATGPDWFSSFFMAFRKLKRVQRGLSTCARFALVVSIPRPLRRAGAQSSWFVLSLTFRATRTRLRKPSRATIEPRVLVLCG